MNIEQLFFNAQENSVFSFLNNIFGINKKKLCFVLDYLKLNPNKKLILLTVEERERLKNFLFIKENYINVNLKNNIKKNIENKKNIFSFEGKRHKQGLPLRGQRTRTNSRTLKNKKNKN